MRANLSWMPAGVLLLIGGCSAPPPPEPQGPPAPEFKVTATLKDIMDSVIDTNADFIWNSVATTVSAKGVEERRPQTDDDWKEVRRHTIALIEGVNLLLIPGRRVARPGEKSENPDVELPPEKIEALINEDRATFQTLAHALQDSLAPVLDAVEKKDPEALLNAGEPIDRACENCHLKYWYPGQPGFYDQQPPVAPADSKAGEKKDAAK